MEEKANFLKVAGAEAGKFSYLFLFIIEMLIQKLMWDKAQKIIHTWRPHSFPSIPPILAFADDIGLCCNANI